jgi:outer membrane protein
MHGRHPNPAQDARPLLMKHGLRTSKWAFVALFLVSCPLMGQGPPTASSWNVSLGGGVLIVPSYAGAEEHRLLPIPMMQVAYRERIYLGPSTTGNGFGLGAYAVRTQRIGLAAELGFLSDRPSSRADALAGMDDRDLVITASASLTYRVNALEAGLSVTQGLNDAAGLLAGARLGFTQMVGRKLITSGGIGATFANARQMGWDFGVIPAEAGRRQALIALGDDRLEADEGNPYAPDGGLRHLGASLSLVYILSSRWTIIGFGGVERLSDEAAASPLVRQRGQVSGGIGLGYRL